MHCFVCGGAGALPHDFDDRCAFGVRLGDLRRAMRNDVVTEARVRGVSVLAVTVAERGLWHGLPNPVERQYYEEIYRGGTI